MIRVNPKRYSKYSIHKPKVLRGGTYLAQVSFSCSTRTIGGEFAPFVSPRLKRSVK